MIMAYGIGIRALKERRAQSMLQVVVSLAQGPKGAMQVSGCGSQKAVCEPCYAAWGMGA